MVNNAKKIERFEKRVKTIEEHLAEIKKQVDTDKLKKEKDKLSEDISLVKEEITEHLDELKKNVEENTDDIKKLEDLSKKVDSFSPELDSLKAEVLKKDEKGKNDENKEDEKDENEWEPSFFANMFYGWLIANTLGNIPLIGKSIKSWTDKKLKESAQDKKDEDAGKKEKPGFFKRIFKTVLWSGIATGALWLGKKIIPDNWSKEVRSWLPWTDEAKAKKQEEEKNNEKDQTETKENRGTDEWENKEKDKEEYEQILPVVLDENNEENSNIENQNLDENVELSDEEKKINEEVKKMYSEWYSELYILMKMYGMWFVPRLSSSSSKIHMRFFKVLQWRPLEKMWEIRSDLKNRIIQSIWINRDIATQLKIESLAKNMPDLATDFDNKSNKLIDVLDDFEKGKIKTLDDLYKSHPEIVKDFWDKKFLQRQNEYLESIKVKSQNEFDRMTIVESDLKVTDQELKKIKIEAENKLKELDANAKTADAKTKKKLQLEANKIVDDYNKRATYLEKKTGLHLSHMNAVEVQRLSKIGVVDNVLKFNWKVDTFMNRKVSKFMIWFSLFSLASDYSKGVKNWKQVALEVGDAWIGMVPFAGWAYDVWTSITWKGIAGQLSTWDRRLRWVVWWASLVLDVAWLFTFGAWNAASAALKASMKGWTAIAKTAKTIKTVDKAADIGKAVVKWAEVVMTWSKVLWLGFLWYNLVAWAAPIVYERADKKLTPDIEVTPNKKD